MASLHINLLASFQVRINGRSVNDFPTDKARALLAYLVVERQRAHRRETLAHLLWPEQPDQRARQNLRQALSSLRQLLHDGPDTDIPFLLIDRHQVQFNPAANLWLDVAAFTTLADTCERHRHRARHLCLPCLQRLETLADLYVGDFLAGFFLTGSVPFEEWALLKREWLHCRAIESLTELADFYERRGDYAAARHLAQRQVQMEPWREESHRQLMRLLAEDGQRSAALAQYKACSEALRQAFGADPTQETVRLYTAIREETARLVWEERPFVVGLPPASTPMIGRETEAGELAELLADPEARLITLVGPGGMGKTRLAREVATAHLGLFPDGVYWLELADLQTAVLVIPALARRLGIVLAGKEPPEAQVLAYLRAKELLLILDNAEHLPELAGQIAAWLPAAPGLTLLITSRERLSLREERVYPLEGLVDANGSALPEAAQLFIHSAQLACHHFQPKPAEQAAIGEICRLVEGMPLALELAAAWTPERSCANIAYSLNEDMAVLTAVWQNAPERQRSMQATITYSWRFLAPDDQLAFACLALFCGDFTTEAAQAVAGVEGTALARLAAKSLLRRVGNGRYQLHVLIRQFAAHKLADYAGQAERIAAAHAAHYLAFLAGQEAALKGSGQEAALAAIEQEIGNIRQAWGWVVDQMAAGQAEAVAWIGDALESLFLFHALRSWYQAGAVLFERAVTAVAPCLPQANFLRGELLARQARCLEFTAPPEEATALYQESLACFAAAGATEARALPLYGLGYMAHIQGDYAASCDYFAESLAHYQAVGDRWGEANVLSSLCLTQRRRGAFAEARQAGEESLVIRQVLGDRRGIASSQNNLGLVYCALGEYATAEAALQESLDICRELGNSVGMANAFTGLCHTAFQSNDWAGAARYQQDALILYREAGDLWGVAIAYNNLGQIVQAEGQIAQAARYFRQGIQVYRQLGMKTGLAHTLGNLALASLALGEKGAAARSLTESLALALELGDRPIILEGLTRTAALWAEAQPGVWPVAVLAFALRQPELLQETRQEAEPRYEALVGELGVEETAVVAQIATSFTWETATAEALAKLQAYSTFAEPTAWP
jgi:predicted ATPase/DNA-binding SARP family transcriptional activator/Tfp pilus assembly protein PilF